VFSSTWITTIKHELLNRSCGEITEIAKVILNHESLLAFDVK